MPFSEVERQTSYFSAPGIEAQEIIALVVPLSLAEMTGVPRPVAGAEELEKVALTTSLSTELVTLPLLSFPRTATTL